MTPVGDLKGIGPKSSEWLIEARIETVEDLEQLGPVESLPASQVTVPGSGYTEHAMGA